MLGAAKESKSHYDISVMVKDDGLWALNLSKTEEEIHIAKAGIYKNIIISPDGLWVAYTRDAELCSLPLLTSAQERIKLLRCLKMY